MKITSKLSGAAVLGALAASSCCIAPVLTLIVGSSSLATIFSWLEPARPFFIGFTVLILAFAWFQKFKKSPKDACDCPTVKQPTIFKSTATLIVLTLFSGLMLSFPLYSMWFYPNSQHQATTISHTATTVDLKIKGMTCEACSQHIAYELNQLQGVLQTTVSYTNGNAKISFDATQISTEELEQTIQSIGYKTQIK